jgi:hypothetical protein
MHRFCIHRAYRPKLFHTGWSIHTLELSLSVPLIQLHTVKALDVLHFPLESLGCRGIVDVRVVQLVQALSLGGPVALCKLLRRARHLTSCLVLLVLDLWPRADSLRESGGASCTECITNSRRCERAKFMYCEPRKDSRRQTGLGATTTTQLPLVPVTTQCTLLVTSPSIRAAGSSCYTPAAIGP